MRADNSQPFVLCLSKDEGDGAPGAPFDRLRANGVVGWVMSVTANGAVARVISLMANVFAGGNLARNVVKFTNPSVVQAHG